MENISAQMAEMRDIVANQFPTLGIKEYHMNEVIGANNVHSPGATLASLVFLEAGNVDYAARATWTSDPLNGLLVDFKTPRPVWWAYKVYADTFPGVRIRTASPDPSIVGLASRDPDGRLLRILVGHYAKRGEPSPPREVTLRVANLSFRTPSVSVELQKIPGSADPLPAGPIGVFKKTLPIANRGPTVDIGQVAKDDVYVVLIGSP